MNTNRPEHVLITDALIYIRERTGYDFERRQFTRWIEAGEVLIDGVSQELESTMVGGRWYIRRESLDLLVGALNRE
ncbi:MAG TPA: hypothetical protein VLD57_07500 [Blastocatellia bacterium]|nr:hypothetical protein [Blastocatellia bacterium]